MRRLVKQAGWPWLLDRLIEQEVQARKFLEAEERERLVSAHGPSVTVLDSPGAPLEAPASPSPHRLVAPVVAGWPAASPPATWGPFLTYPVPGLASEIGLPWLPLALPASGEDGTLNDDVKRRTFMLGIPAAWLLSRSKLSHRLWSRAEAATVDATTLGELAAAIANDKRLCNRLGSRAAHGLVTEHLRLATDLLQSSPPAALRPRLAAIASEAAAEAGFVCHDQGQFSAARSYYRLAAELAREAGAPLLETFVLANWGDRLGEAGEAVSALAVLDHAGKLALSRRSPATATHLALVEAETHAILGHTDASLRALDRADNALDRGDRSDDPPFLYWLHEGVLAGWKGGCLMHLGRLEEADASLTQALSAWDPSFVRDRAITLVRLANLRLRQQELSEALDLAVATSSPKFVQQIRDLRAELEPWKDSSAVKALNEQMVAASWM